MELRARRDMFLPETQDKAPPYSGSEKESSMERAVREISWACAGPSNYNHIGRF